MNDVRGVYIEKRWSLCSRSGGARPDLQCPVGSDGFSCAQQFLLITQKKTDTFAQSAATGHIGVTQSLRSARPQLIEAMLKFK